MSSSKSNRADTNKRPAKPRFDLCFCKADQSRSIAGYAEADGFVPDDGIDPTA